MKNTYFVFLFLSAFLFSCNNESKENSSSPADSSAKQMEEVSAATSFDSIDYNTPASAAEILSRTQIPILCYHQIRDYTATDSRTAKPYIVPVSVFEQQMKALADSGYQTILPKQLYDYLLFGKTLPAKSVLITFDDTRLDQYTSAIPIMEKHQFKGAFYIMTVAIGKPGYMSKEQIADLHQKGHSIGSHTWDHQNVKKLTGKDWDTQITKPSSQLETITGEPIWDFAYPFGLWNKEAIPELKQRGIKLAFQLSDARDNDDPLHSVRRIIVPGTMSGASLIKSMKTNF